MYIFSVRALASCRRRPLSSNVRPHNPQLAASQQTASKVMRHIHTIFVVIPLAAMLGCGTKPDQQKPDSVTQDPDRPTRVRFVVHGDPGLSRYPEINSLPLKVHEKIREGMRRYAQDELRTRGICPNGFAGPEVVLAYETERMTRRFWVDCL